jgi:hypothetical protein
MLLLIHTRSSWWRVDTDRRLVIDPDYRVRAYASATLLEGGPVEFVWAPGQLGEQRRTYSSGVVFKIVDETDDDAASQLFWDRVQTGNEPMRW